MGGVGATFRNHWSVACRAVGMRRGHAENKDDDLP